MKSISIAITFSIILVGCATGTFTSAPSNPSALITASKTMEPRISVITLGVSDMQRSFRFYRDGLGFPTNMNPDGGIVLIATSGTRLFLYPNEKLAKDVSDSLKIEKCKDAFPGFTFGHCARKKEDVDAILSLAEKAGGKIVKAAAAASWGGYSGYFADPDGYLWEVAYADQWKFNPDGSVMVED
jgi:catechol 2,3-dioxygenase-like lactoylglutathione lyase family enzyme